MAVIRAANATDLRPETNRLLFARDYACSGYAVIRIVAHLALAFRGADTSAPIKLAKDHPARRWGLDCGDPDS